jgi:hypothetical protein
MLEKQEGHIIARNIEKFKIATGIVPLPMTSY